MSESFKMPDPGEGVHEVEIIDVHVGPGDEVEDGDLLFSIETDKAAVDIPAPFAGEIDSIEVASGDHAEVGDVLLRYSAKGSQKSRESAAGKSRAEGGKESKAKSTAKGTSRTRDKSTAKGADQSRDDSNADGGNQKKGKSAAKGDGETEDKRKTKGAGKTAAGSDSESGHSTDESSAHDDRPVPAAPSTRRLARELGVDLETVEGSGDAGRVLARDVHAAAGTEASGGGSDDWGFGDGDFEDRDLEGSDRSGPRPDATAEAAERQPLKGIRRITARRMQQAWNEIPQVTHEDLADITALERLRQRAAEAAEEAGAKLTITAFAVKALASALRSFPRFNASFDDGDVVMHRACHIGIAVDTEDGLIVPVIRDAGHKSVLEIAIEAEALAERARARELERDELRGGTITLTNPGGIGGTRFTPIVNPPQAAILGLARASRMPVVNGEGGDARVNTRLLLPLMLTFDHRLNDGADAARFVNRLRRMLSAPETFLLHA